jgi:hypothetical protein
MAQLTQVIGNQNFELVRDRIGAILLTEIEQQVYLGSDITEPEIFIERTVPFSAENEFPAINVQFAGGVYETKNVREAEGGYLYNIDIFTLGKNTSAITGDKLANIKLQRLMGVCRAILENPVYRTLSFAPPSLSRVKVQELSIAAPQVQDGLHTAMGRIVYRVEVDEDVELKTAPLIVDALSTIKLESTDKGYKYISNF